MIENVIFFAFSFIFMKSILYTLLSIISISKKYSKQVWIKDVKIKNYPYVTLIIPLFKEGINDIARTFNSIIKQKYPRSKLQVLIVVEEYDEETYSNVNLLKHLLERNNIRHHIIINKGPRKCKAKAINYALKYVDKRSNVIGIYDGGDDIPDDLQVAKAVNLINKGFDVVGVKVLRNGRSLLGFLSLIDSTLWCHVMLPALVKLTSYPLFSGEGLFISRRFIEQIGGLPEKLTEDSYLAIYLAMYRRKAALLDSIVLEGAPANLRSLIKQRLRWFKGYVECMVEVIMCNNLTLPTKLKLLMAYLSPYTLTAMPTSCIVFTLSIFVSMPIPIIVMSLAVIVFTLIAPLYVVFIGVRDQRIFVAPLYWIFLGLIAFISILIPRISWYKTIRTPLSKVSREYLEFIEVPEMQKLKS